ncbi:hypothetical protein SINU_09240 [Sporolactobacillus inulinus CASD]|uniref:Uncharacterized protein n=1 Tax=Sporolactobacillus inulinus CASD TaxID=1069536 RepID=A0A0U1QN49_9BACL|nr:hypothetical protein SINU_09240 [Sporolactobacillus inulinus CASD]GEB78108.1 hypothetical protein SIN01_24530 [Sporolactobacillus inulinus]
MFADGSWSASLHQLCSHQQGLIADSLGASSDMLVFCGSPLWPVVNRDAPQASEHLNEEFLDIFELIKYSGP